MIADDRALIVGIGVFYIMMFKVYLSTKIIHIQYKEN